MWFKQKKNKKEQQLSNQLNEDLKKEFFIAIEEYNKSIDKYNKSDGLYQEINYKQMIACKDKVNNIICTIKLNMGIPLNNA